MQRFEYKVVPAPRRGEKARGVKTSEDRFALALSTLMNALGSEGWEYVRADTLPLDERSGLTGTKTSFQNLLVFRRVLQDMVEAPAASPRLVASEPPAAPAPRLGPAETPAGPAPVLGPASPGLAAE
ncbi:DUF4177 domain-containing protein [Paracoccaceae bacterium]